MPDEPVAVEFHVEDHPDPLDIDVLETQIRREASAAMGLGNEADLAIFVRNAGRVVAGISGSGHFVHRRCHRLVAVRDGVRADGTR